MYTPSQPRQGSTELTQSELMEAIARRFYFDDVSKMQIGNEFGISRFRVARLLEKARAIGMVRIEISNVGVNIDELAQLLARHLHLDHVCLVEANRNIVTERDTLARQAAKYLSTNIRPNDRIGFSWGRTLMPIARYLGPLPPSEFVQITGVIGDDPSKSPITLIGQISQQSGVEGRMLIAPLFSSSAETAKVQRKEPAVARILELFDDIDIAVLSVGAWDSRVTQLEQLLPQSDIEVLDQRGAVADFSGVFFDADGNYLNLSLNDRRISITVEQILKVPNVLMVAGGTQKTEAIHAVCRSGIPTALVTTAEVAQELLSLPAISKGKYR